jgi:hypothetical protein
LQEIGASYERGGFIQLWSASLTDSKRNVDPAHRGIGRLSPWRFIWGLSSMLFSNEASLEIFIDIAAEAGAVFS